MDLSSREIWHCINISRICINIAIPLSLKVTEPKIAEFVNSVDLDEVAHNTSPRSTLFAL